MELIGLVNEMIQVSKYTFF